MEGGDIRMEHWLVGRGVEEPPLGVWGGGGEGRGKVRRVREEGKLLHACICNRPFSAMMSWGKSRH